MTLEEYHALCDRDLKRQDFAEYCAALAPWGIFQVYRSSTAPEVSPVDLMFQSRARHQFVGDEGSTAPARPPQPPPSQGRPAVLLAPVPISGARYAVRGERPPSKYGPGHPDPLIDHLDAYMGQRYGDKKVKRG